MTRGDGRNRPLVATAVALALAGVIGTAAAAPARADDHHHGYEHRDDHWRDHDWHRHHRHGPPPVYIAPAPIYAPPPVIYAPPPPPPGLNLIFPINIR